MDTSQNYRKQLNKGTSNEKAWTPNNALQPLIDEVTKEISDEIQAKLSPKFLTAEEKENVKKKAAMEAQCVFAIPLNEEQEKEQGIGTFNMQAAFVLLGIDKTAFA
ncbi:hypothetical protein [Paenibacillus glycinis]|uniref:Uncharacterized protein n=1 Tax=Paenibacillus glycinis TaxID=2697035 RepID=A0ABW9Y050_9BACL|nr:hypothetical protein [Paenibacillus glycinis]NBD28367.1 hypothetical protein [Paenibacillus glycinis]